uniref:Hexosyltransferase n=1 Tax=Oryza glumipatula TaxID=40148 RepID=A0A0E0BCP9_9ORYZ
MTVSSPSPSAEEPFRVFVGYDPREDEAYEVCRRSLLRHASIPVDVRPIRQPDLRAAGLYWRERGPTESTEFSFTRFLTPYLAGYRGWALFVDCDFLYLADIAGLLACLPSSDPDHRLAVACVKHEYAPAEATKMDGAIQTVYPRKNWSSMVLYNCGHPKNVAALTPDAVSTQTGAFLHRFAWLDDDEIGEIPFAWNFLVGHNKVDPADPSTQPKAIHYTSGGPWFERYRNCDFAELWIKEADELKADKEKEKQKQQQIVMANGEKEKDEEGN